MRVIVEQIKDVLRHFNNCGEPFIMNSDDLLIQLISMTNQDRTFYNVAEPVLSEALGLGLFERHLLSGKLATILTELNDSVIQDDVTKNLLNAYNTITSKYPSMFNLWLNRHFTDDDVTVIYTSLAKHRAEFLN